MRIAGAESNLRTRGIVLAMAVAFFVPLNAALAGPRLQVLHEFSGPDGRAPKAGLVQGADGNFYGTTEVAGHIPAQTAPAMARCLRSLQRAS